MVNTAKLTGHVCLGPGNPYPPPKGEKPVDKADVVACEHDKFYTEILQVADNLSDSEFRAKVAEADQKAIQDFLRNFSEDGDDWDWYSLAGAGGLSIKAAVERAIGQIIYPRKSSIAGKHG